MYDEQQQDDPLQKQFKTLQKEWDSIKQSFSRSNRRSSTTTTVAGDHRVFHPYEDSPKELMTLLQNEYSPAKECSHNSGHHDQDAVEINEAEANGIDGECFDFDEESEVSTEISCKGFENYDKYNQLSGFGGSCTGSSQLDVAGKGVRAVVKSGGDGGSCTGLSRLDVAGKGVRAAAESGGDGGSCTGSSRLDVRGGRVAAVKGGGGGCVGKWFVSLVVVVFALAIVALECSSEHKSILVPT
ncbi:hypothetical protein HanIR_Chr04g0158281 [Helianthus annuus]|nr:hypothetical protein HanIR_Chr04g0158281 [Helianthus annuus]